MADTMSLDLDADGRMVMSFSTDDPGKMAAFRDAATECEAETVANIDDVTDEQLVEGFMHTYGMTRPAAERQVAIARGDIPTDVVSESKP